MLLALEDYPVHALWSCTWVVHQAQVAQEASVVTSTSRKPIPFSSYKNNCGASPVVTAQQPRIWMSHWGILSLSISIGGDSLQNYYQLLWTPSCDSISLRKNGSKSGWIKSKAIFIQIAGYLQHTASVDWLVVDKRLELLVDWELLLVLMRSNSKLGVDAAMPREK